MQTILVVDDEPHIREVVAFALRKEGFAVLEAGDGAEALALASSAPPDLVILDVMMPELDGIEACRQLRRSSDVPVIFLSSRDEEIDRIVGLELGADDYVVKPFSPRELVTRVKVVLRRRGLAAAPLPAPDPAMLQRGRLRLDRHRFEASWDGRPLALTVTEFAILTAIARHPGHVLSRGALMDVAYPDRRVVSDRTIDSHVRHIRAKLAGAGGAPIETVHGLGYRLVDPSGGPQA